MIADCKKDLLHLDKAVNGDGLWTPPLPETTERIKSKFTRRLLVEQSDGNHERIAVLRELLTHPDVHRYFVESPEQVQHSLETLLEASESLQKALDAALDDVDRRNK